LIDQLCAKNIKLIYTICMDDEERKKAEYLKKWREKNPDYQKKYYQAYKRKTSISKRKYYEENKEKIKSSPKKIL
jgi:hypothetical protein